MAVPLAGPSWIPALKQRTLLRLEVGFSLSGVSMLSSVQSRSNHYQTLGLTPRASEAEINEAFARKIGLHRAHPAGAAQVCIAYETLRNPASRRDYDLALGLTPQVLPQPSHLTISVTQQRWASFIAAVPTDRHPQPAAPPEPHVTADRQSRPLDRGRHRLLEAAQKHRGREAVPTPRKPAHIPSDHPIHRFIPQGGGDAEVRPMHWNRTGLTVSALLVGVIVVGAWAGTIAGGDVEAAQAEQAAPPALATPKPLPANAAPATDAADPDVARAPSGQRHRSLAEPAAPPGEGGELDKSTPQAASASDDFSATATNAKLPLPNQLIARTIDRIGFACGAVASGVAAGPGAFTVTCTSGDSYQATRVGGRYRFRRLGA
jgi:hypothetical protein